MKWLSWSPEHRVRYIVGSCPIRLLRLSIECGISWVRVPLGYYAWASSAVYRGFLSHYAITRVYCAVFYVFVLACVDLTYGQNCNEKCPDRCYNKTCHLVTGACLFGCIKGWNNQQCYLRKFIHYPTLLLSLGQYPC